jgi:hypothetical protein
MAATWQEHFVEKPVAAAHAAGDERLATAVLHRRKKTVSVQHAQVRSVECSFSGSRKSGSQAQVLLVGCQPKRGTEIDGPALKKEQHESGCGGDVRVDDDGVWLQCQWGHGDAAVFPVQDARRVKELSGWAIRSIALLLDHLERRRHVVTIAKAQADSGPLDLRVTLEQYLEDLLVEQFACGDLGRIDILARDRTSGDYVVIELKRDQGDDEVVGQVSRYMGWIKQRRADQEKVGVKGIIVAHEATDRLRWAVLPHPTISLYTYKFSVSLAPVVATVQQDKSKVSC